MSNQPKACEGGRALVVSTGTNDYHQCLYCKQLWNWKDFCNFNCEHKNELDEGNVSAA